jgi:hypothetical protein
MLYACGTAGLYKSQRALQGAIQARFMHSLVAIEEQLLHLLEVVISISSDTRHFFSLSQRVTFLCLPKE